MTADDPLSLVLSRLDNVRKNGTGYTARCPAHDDRHNSLSIGMGDDGRVLLKDHANCETERIVAAVGLTMRDLFPPHTDGVRGNGHSRRLVAAYDYRDEVGTLLYQAVRFEPKGFAQRRPDGYGGWVWNLAGVRHVPYRLPELLAADPDAWVLIVEGEKDADRLAALGFPATTNAAGAGKWRPDLSEYLRGRRVCILPDNDGAGEKHAALVAPSLAGIAAETRVLWLPNLPDKGDVSDWLDAGGTADELVRLIEEAPAWMPRADTGPQTAGAMPAPVSEAPWPTLDDAALYGLAGDVVRTIAPHTEGDPVGLLVGFLVMFGSAVGPSPHARVGATRHRVNENAVTVGETARARKGTASNEVERIVAAADPEWKERVQGGLSSGEGLIYAVRDPIWKPNKDGELKLADPGVDDKRLLALEPEFSSVLRVAGRDGNTVSEMLRRAWDGNDLRTLTRGAPLAATAPHISLLGHVTKHELVRELSETYQVNGFANRHLFVCIRRSKELPHGGSLADADVAALVARTRTALDWARRRGEVRRDAEANAVWEAVYSALTAERPGMFGAITARAEAHVLRLSLLYALLDGVETIGRPHLEAALAVWQYAEASARFIFGDATGDPTADAILAALRNAGRMTQTQISDLFSRNLRAGRLEAALALLLRLGKAHTWQDDAAKSGRPPVYWEATT